MEENLISKIKNILGMQPEQVEVQPETEVIAEQVEVQAAAPEIPAPDAESPAEDTSPTETPEMEKVIEALTAAIADLQGRMAACEAMLTDATMQIENSKETQEKLNKVVELIANQPSASAPKKTESSFKSSLRKDENTKDERLKNMLGIFQQKQK